METLFDLRATLRLHALQVRTLVHRLRLQVSCTRREREAAIGQFFLRLVDGVGGHAERERQLRPRQRQAVLRLDELLFARRRSNLCAQQVGIHRHAALDPRAAAGFDGLRGLQRVLGDLQLLLRQQHAVVGLDRLVHQLLIGAVELLLASPACTYLARLTPYQLCRPSNRLHCPEKRLEKLLIGVGVLSWLSAKSARVKFCCRSLEPKTNTGSLPRSSALGEHDLRQQRRPGFAYRGDRDTSIRQRRLAQRILLQRHADGLRQRQRSRRLRRRWRAATPAAIAASMGQDFASVGRDAFTAATLVKCRLHPYAPTNAGYRRRHNVERRVQFGAQLHHRADRAILLLREPDGVFHRMRRKHQFR